MDAGIGAGTALDVGRQPNTACIASCKTAQTVGAFGWTWNPA